MESFGSKKGFTVIEMLIIFSIISIIFSYIFITVNNSRSRARDSQRAADLVSLKSAINEYYREKGSYPLAVNGCSVSTSEAIHWIGAGDRSNCVKENFIVGLTPNFINLLPKDPGPESLDSGDSLSNRGLVYIHDITGDKECYKVVLYMPENANTVKYKSLWDPARDGGSDNSNVDGTTPTAWAVYSVGCAAK